jgi:hypothetical protein
MKSSSALVVAALALGSSHVAYARDHMELVCAAVAEAKDGGDKIALFVHMFENRASDGRSRDETLSTIYQGKLFQATRVNKSGGWSTEAPIVLKAGSEIRFRGTYTLAPDGDGYVLRLKGEVNDDPRAKKAEFRAAVGSLSCVDLSI